MEKIMMTMMMIVPSDGVSEALHFGGDVFQIPNGFARL